MWIIPFLRDSTCSAKKAEVNYEKLENHTGM